MSYNIYEKVEYQAIVGLKKDIRGRINLVYFPPFIWMEENKRRLNLYTVNKEYCEFLRKYDNRVPIVNGEKEGRLFVGILICVNNNCIKEEELEYAYN